MFRRKNKISSKVITEEYFVNDTYLKKLYNLYIHQSKFEKALDFAVFFAVFFTIVSLILEFILDANHYIVHFIHTFSVIILIIFAIELFVSYLKSKTKKHFFKKHGIDFILVAFLSFYFLFAPYLAIARAERLIRFKNIVQEIKHYKIAFNWFKNLFRKLF